MPQVLGFDKKYDIIYWENNIMISYWKEIEEKNSNLYPKGTYWKLNTGGVGVVTGYSFSYIILRTWDKHNGKVILSLTPKQIGEAATANDYFYNKRKAIYDLICKLEDKISELNKEWHNDTE